MNNRFIRFLSADSGTIALLAALIVLLALGGIELARVFSVRMLAIDAESTCGTWAASLLGAADDIPAIIAGAQPSPRTTHLLREASQIGDVYRYRIWDRAGRLIYSSERIASSEPSSPIRQRLGNDAAISVLSGKPFTRSVAASKTGDPAYFAFSCIPIKREGAVIGVLDVYIDQTADRAFYEKSLLLTEGIIAALALLAGGIPGFMVYRRMAAHRAAQAEAIFLAEHDSLTGLANRKRLNEAASDALAWTRRNHGQVALLLLDVDKFKEINDNFGHDKGDEVLRVFAVRIGSTVREEDLLARLGGDEFAILQVGVEQPARAAHLAENLLEVLARPLSIEGTELTCQASIGVAIAPTDAEEWGKLLTCADAALHRSKAAGRNRLSFFEAGMDAAIRERWRIETEMRKAIHDNAFELAYQPVFSLRGGALVGFEALLRWPHAWAPCYPSHFIPIAEESGLIVPIGKWVLRTACETAKGWKQPLKVAVNLSPIQFRTCNLVRTIRETLDHSGLDPANLELEVTESVWIQNADEVFHQLEELRSMGISIALDDFGTGFSSLTYLLKLPFDKVKIDQSFVAGMKRDPKAAAIVHTIVALGKTLDLTITAEGVETQAQVEALIETGCDQAQGYFYGRPLPPELAAALVESSASSIAST